MERYNTQQRILIVKNYYQSGESFAATVRKMRTIMGHRNAPNEATVRRLMKKFEQTGSVNDVKTETRVRLGRSTENIAAVRANVEESPTTSIRHRGVRYREMLTNFFVPKLQNMDLNSMWFQQDGATCHTARETVELLHESFPGRVISRFGDRHWPPRSCDLTPLDFFL